MKKKISLTSIAIWLVAIICFVYCAYFIIFRPVHKGAGSFYSKFKFGLVQTTNSEDASYITYYSDNLTKVYTQKIKNGSVGESLDTPQIANSKVYFVPQDTTTKQNNSTVVSVNLDTGKKKTYDVKQQNIEHYQVDIDSIYTTATTNKDVILSKYIKNTEEIKTLSLGQVTLDTLQLHGGMLFAFTSTDGKTSIQMIDADTLTVTKTYPVPDFKGTVTSTCMAGNSLFFAYEDAKNTTNPSGVGLLNLFDKTVVTKPLTLAHASQIFYSKDKLIVTAKNSNQIAVYDTINEKADYVTLQNNVVQSAVSGNYLYSIDEKTLYEYKLSDFTVENKIDLPLKDTDTAKFHYSSFFLK